MIVRPATPEDGEVIGDVHVRSWQAAYRGLMPQDHLDRLDPVERGRVWRERLTAGLAERSSMLVVEDGAGVVGFVYTWPSPDDDAAGAGEVAAIYLHPDAWGRGAGRALMRAAVAQLRADGFEQATLWVLDGNERAIRFYGLAGWAPDGATRVETDRGFDMAERRFRRLLAVPVTIGPDDPGRPDVRELLDAHRAFALSVTPVAHANALDADGISEKGLALYSARRDGRLMAVAALRDLGEGTVELKSMHTSAAARGLGIGRALLEHLLDVARRQGYERMNLDTGTDVAFAPARDLYHSVGFETCPPYGGAQATPVLTWMTLNL